MLVTSNPPGSQLSGLSHGVSIKGSGIFVSTGQVGTNEAGEIVTSSLEDQVVAAFENVKRALEAAGLGFEHVARATCFVTSFEPELLAAIRTVRARYFNQDGPPAGVMVQAGLYDPALHLEIEVLAVVP